MIVIVALCLAYIGGPLSLAMLALAAYGFWKHPKDSRPMWPGFLAIFGVILLIIAIYWLVALMNTNFAY